MKDEYSKILWEKMSDWGFTRICEIEDEMSRNLEKGVAEIIQYLNNFHFSMPLGLHLRRYMFEKYGEKSEDESYFIFELDNGQVIKTKNYLKEDYDIKKDDINEYTDIFNYINQKYNTDENGNLTLEITRADIRNQLRCTTACTREKMFLLSFALHMNNDDMKKFLTDVLAEQTYNYREPTEIIAYFCQSNEKFNSYRKYVQLCDEFESRKKRVEVFTPKKKDYSFFAKNYIKKGFDNEEILFEFLLANIANFHTFSETAYREFITLYQKASDKLLNLPKDERFKFDEDEPVEKLSEKVLTAIKEKKLINAESLATIMLSVPRAEFKKTQKDQEVIINDFISINNGETDGKVQTTGLPKSITKNYPVSDRLRALIKRKRPVDRKILVFMKYYVFYLNLKNECTSTDASVFMSECNDLLVRCGMSILYPGNRFENIVLLSLLSNYSFEMFEIIIEYSFFNEPGPIDQV
ncbi:MAG: hypothetical protein ACI4W6_07585 [Acutalibacteraceae bacterium]